MTLIVTKSLEYKNDNDLKTLFKIMTERLAQSEPHSHERRNALASLENINRAMTARPF